MSYKSRAPYLESNLLFSYTQVKQAFAQSSTGNFKTLALLPVGCIEQHGPFLPVQTDSILAEGLCHHVGSALSSESYRAVTFPPIHFTPTQTNVDFPGTVSVSANAFANYAEEVCRSLLQQPFDAVIIVNGHGPAEFRLKEIAFELVNKQFQEPKRKPKPAFVVSAYDFDQQVASSLGFKPGRHADWREFLSLYALLGAEFFPPEILKQMRVFQQENDFAVKGSSILGVPMKYRSIDGVQGDPFPFEVDQVPVLAAQVWNLVVEAATSKIAKELKGFASQVNELGNNTGDL